MFDTCSKHPKMQFSILVLAYPFNCHPTLSTLGISACLLTSDALLIKSRSQVFSCQSSDDSLCGPFFKLIELLNLSTHTVVYKQPWLGITILEEIPSHHTHRDTYTQLQLARIQYRQKRGSCHFSQTNPACPVLTLAGWASLISHCHCVKFTHFLYTTHNITVHTLPPCWCWKYNTDYW